MKKFLCFSTLVFGGLTLGMALGDIARGENTTSTLITLFSGVAVIFAGWMQGRALKADIPVDEEVAKQAAEWERQYRIADAQRAEAMALMKRIEVNRDEWIEVANSSRRQTDEAIEEWRKAKNLLSQFVK